MEDVPSGLNSEDSQRLKSWYNRGRPGNSYDTAPLETRLREQIEGDSVAEKAMDLFLKSMFWHLVDHCEDKLSMMTNSNEQLFRETLILLAPHLFLGNYTERIVKIIGNPTLITDAYFQNRDLLCDMFFFSAVNMGKQGCCWCLTEIGTSIYRELNILNYLFHREEYDKNEEVDIRGIVYEYELTEDVIPPIATDVWPNLPDAFTIQRWLKK
jgi:hypothetical protein